MTMQEFFTIDRMKKFKETSKKIVGKKGSVADADLLLSDSVYEWCENWEKYSARAKNLDAYFINSMYNNFWSWRSYHNRNKRKFITTELPNDLQDLKDDVYDLELDLERKKLENLVRSKVKKLNLHEQYLYQMVFVDNMTFRQISKKTDIPLASVYTMYRYMKDKIKDMLNDN